MNSYDSARLVLAAITQAARAKGGLPTREDVVAAQHTGGGYIDRGDDPALVARLAPRLHPELAALSFEDTNPPRSRPRARHAPPLDPPERAQGHDRQHHRGRREEERRGGVAGNVAECSNAHQCRRAA